MILAYMDKVTFCRHGTKWRFRENISTNGQDSLDHALTKDMGTFFYLNRIRGMRGLLYEEEAALMSKESVDGEGEIMKNNSQAEVVRVNVGSF